MKIHKVPSGEVELLRLVPTPRPQPRPAADSGGSIAGGNCNVIRNPAVSGAMNEGAVRVADAHLNWHRVLERTLWFNDASAAPVVAAETGRWGGELRTR